MNTYIHKRIFINYIFIHMYTQVFVYCTSMQYKYIHIPVYINTYIHTYIVHFHFLTIFCLSHV